MRAQAVLGKFRASQTETVPVHDYSIFLQAAGRAPTTARLRLFHLQQLAAACGDPLTLTTRDLEAYLAARAHLSAASRKSIRASLRVFYAWAAREGLVTVSPAETLLPIRLIEAPARVAPDADIEAALAGASARDRAIILLARCACLRRAEIARLHVNDRDGGMLRILGKGGRIRMVWIDKTTERALDALDAIGFYFPGRFSGHIHPDALSKIVQRVTGWHPHALRHAGASAAYRATSDIRTLQLYLGHASINTTARYVTVSEDKLTALADALRLAA